MGRMGRTKAGVCVLTPLAKCLTRLSVGAAVRVDGEGSPRLPTKAEGKKEGPVFR